jgi:hypothetical protein
MQQQVIALQLGLVELLETYPAKEQRPFMSTKCMNADIPGMMLWKA